MDALLPTKKPKPRKALTKHPNPSSSEANIIAGVSDLPNATSIPPGETAEKENHESFCKKKNSKALKKGKEPKVDSSSFEKAFEEMREKLERLTIEKEQTEELLKAKEELILQKDKEQEKLLLQLKKRHKIKEFKPTLNLPIVKGDNDQEKKKGKKLNDTTIKKPVTSYLLWCKDQWNEVKKENPKAEFKETSIQLAAKWKTLSAEEKKPYEERYKSEKDMYLKIVGNQKHEQEALRLLEEEEKQKTALELLEQYIQFQRESENPNKKKKKEKDPLKPKQPLSAFFLFSNERRAALLLETNNNVLQVAKITGEEWRNMTDEQKAPYEEAAAKNREQYSQEMALYQNKKEDEASNLENQEKEMTKLRMHEALQLLKKKEKTENLIKKTKEEKKKKKEENNTDPNKPKKPASSFLLFSKEERKKIAEEKPGTNASTVNALISIKWKELSAVEKQVWKSMAEEAMETYKRELEEYNQAAKGQNS